jgi:hypothetical protein
MCEKDVPRSALFPQCRGVSVHVSVLKCDVPLDGRVPRSLVDGRALWPSSIGRRWIQEFRDAARRALWLLQRRRACGGWWKCGRICWPGADRCS